MTTGVGTLRFAAPEQVSGNKKKHCSGYGFKADIYSLGVVLFDMFRDHSIFPRELQELHECLKEQNKVLPELAKKMPK